MIVALDEVIPHGRQAFERLGELRFFPARDLSADWLREVDALVVRSVTRVDATLLEGTQVRFVGTASVGTDHIDVDYLCRRGIRFANAAGSNSNAVSEYVVSALMEAGARHGWDLSRKSLGIIGVGNVGSRVEKKARVLGMEVLLCDPPLRDQTGDPKYLPMEEALGADILTLHVPLTSMGPYPTRHLIDGAVLGRLSPRQYVINSSRGPVVDGAALKQALALRRIEGAVLDVWESEPHIDDQLLSLADIGTAHIAGYSLDGKIRTTEMISEALAAFVGAAPAWDPSGLFPAGRLICPERTPDMRLALHSILRQAYDIKRDDALLRASRSDSPSRSAAEFERLRNHYAFRLEFRHHQVKLWPVQAPLASVCRGLGLPVTD